MSYGLLQKFEDFCPIDNKNALITHGNDYTHLNEIREVTYLIGKEKRVEIKNGKTLVKGNYLRLGNIFEEKLFFSDGYKIYIMEMETGKKSEYGEGIQPYGYSNGIVYQKNSCIYDNDKRIIIPHGDYEVVGRPTTYKNKIYYETRADPAPLGWEVWIYDMDTKEKIKLIEGANPFAYNDNIFFSKWVDSEFKTFCEELK
jgi:hypothetical protein